jgi:hypothetical protein
LRLTVRFIAPGLWAMSSAMCRVSARSIAIAGSTLAVP